MSRWSHLLTDTVHYSAPTGIDARGSKTWGPLVAVRARVERKTRVVRGVDGTEKLSSDTIAHEDVIPAGARIWLPGDNTADTAAARFAIQTGGASFPGGSATLRETYL